MTELAVDMAGLTDPEPPDAEEVPPPSDPWLARRAHGFGASDMAVVLAALGWRSAEDLPVSWGQPRVKAIRVRGLAKPVPRIWLEKAGLRRPLKRRADASAGKEREEALVEQWRMRVARGTAGPDASLIDPGSIIYVERDWPREVLPLVDRESPRLTATPDVLARDVMGRLGCVDTKCSFHAYDGLPWYHAVQIHAQMAACSAEWGAMVEGEGWSAKFRDHAGEPFGAVVTRAFERDEELVRELRAAAIDGWNRVQMVRAEWEKNR